MKVPNFRVNEGITLASLVVSVIVILILASISIYMITGDNNLIFRAGKAKEESERAEIEEALNAAYVKLERKSKYNSVANLDDAVEDVKTKGYEDRIVGQPSDAYELRGEDVTLTKIAPNNTKTITIKKDISESSDGLWYAVIMGKYYKIEDDNGTIKISKEPSNVEINNSSIGDTINITNEDVTIANANIATIEVVEGDKLKVTALNEGSSIITINYNGKTATCNVTVISGSIAIPTASNKTYTGVKQTGVAGGIGYTVIDGEKTDAGTYTAKAVLTDKTNTTWSDGTTIDKNIEWKILPYNLSQSTIENIGTQEFTGNAITPEPEVIVPIPDGDTTKLVKGRDFTYSYINNTAKGTATVTITGEGNYTGSKSTTFEIAPTLVKVTASDYNKVYDGSNHGISLTVTEPTSGCTVYYKEGTTALTKDNYTTGSTTKIEKKDAGTYTIQWYVHTTDNNYSDRSGSNKIIISKKQSTASVEITGTNTQGQKLTAVPTTNGDGTKKYQWFSNTTNSTTGGTKLTESTTSTDYTVGTGLVGKYIYVVLTVEAGTNYKSSNASDITDDENNSTGKSAYVVTYEKGENVTAIGATTAKTTTGNVTLPSITAQDGYTAPGWYNGNTKVGNAGEEAIITGNVTLTAKAEDNKKPDATLSSTNNLKATKQTATISATDEVGVTAYYWGTSSPTSSSAYTTVTSTKNFSTTKDITATGTYYFAAKDDAGNISEIKSVTIHSYVVYNMLDKVEGTQGTYTTAHYEQKSKYTYVAQKGTTVTSTDVCTAPETAGITYKGMASVVPSTTAASVAKTESVALNSNMNLSYWWDRNTYTVAYNSNNGTGTMSTDSVKYKQDYVTKANTFTREGYTWNDWNEKADGTGAKWGSRVGETLNWTYTKSITLYAQWTYKETPTITRNDYNTFTVSAEGGAKYIISKDKTTEPSETDSEWSTTTTKDVSTSAKETWYVWVQDSNGNVSPNSATITSYKVTLTAGTGTTLTAKADTTSGTTVTSGMYVLNKTPVYPTASKNTGYHALVIKKGSTEITSGSKQTISADTTFTTSATANKVTINVKNGTSASTVEYAISLSTNDSSDTTTYTTTNSTGTIEISPVINGTYYIYAGKSSNATSTKIKSGVSVTVNDNSPSAVTVQYYALTLAKGTGISGVSNGETSTTDEVQYLYNATAADRQTIAIDATVEGGHTWSTWTKTSGTNLATFTAGTKSQSVKMGAGSATLTANATYVETPRITRIDYNTFEVSTAGGSEYIISTTQTEVPTASTTGWNETDMQDTRTSAKETWHVWVKDADGNVSPNSATITNYKVTLVEGTGTTLTAKADDTTGEDVKNEMYVLNGTPIYPTGELVNGYKTLVLKKGSETIANESEHIISGDTTFTSSATANTYTISYDYAGGTGGTNKPTSGTYNADVQISNPTKAGYTFVGWTSSSSDGLGENAKTGTTANPTTEWTGTATKNTYFKNLTDTDNGTVKLTATWKANYKLRKVIGASNLISNGGFDNYTLVNPETKTANGVTHTWDKALNGVPGNTSKAYSITSWDEYANGTGANMNVYVPEIGYHAHMRIVNGNNVLRFKTNEAYAGQTAANVSGGVSVTPGTIDANRWLGISQQLTGTNLTAGATYVVTLDAYRVSGNQNITVGIYHATTSSNSERGFNSGTYSFNPKKIGEWETFSKTFTLSSNYVNTINPSLYVYGCWDGTGEIYVDNIRLEKVTDTSYITKTYDSLYTTEELNPVSRSGYSFDGWYSDARYTKRLDETDKFNTNTAAFEDVNTPETSAYIYAKWSFNSYTIAFDKNNPNASGTMSNITATNGVSLTLPTCAYTVPSGVTTKQIFNGWNTKADGSGTPYSAGATVNSLSTAGETVTLYAQWIDALYEVSAPLKYTLTMQEAITAANTNETIKVIKTGSDNYAANVNKTLTLNLNGQTLTRSNQITVSQGNFTVKGSGTLYSTGKGIYNSGSSSSVTISNYATIKCNDRAIEFKSDGRSYSGSLNIENSWIYTTVKANAIVIGSANSVTINNSWVYMPYGSACTIVVNYELSQMTIKGASRIGSGWSYDDSNYATLIYFGTGSNGTTIYIQNKSIIMSGQYNYAAITLDRTATLEVKDEAEIYSLRNNTNTKCIDCKKTGCTISIDTYGWVYSRGTYVITSNSNSPVSLLKGTYVAASQKMVDYTRDYDTLGGTHPHQFYYMKVYNDIALSDGFDLYEFGRGWVKVGNTNVYDWRFFWSNNTLARGLNTIGNGIYYFNENGVMQTGWRHINNYWYCFKAKTGTSGGEAYTGGPHTIDGRKYIFGSDGKMLTGWQYAGNYWYYLNPTETSSYKLGEALKGWHYIDGAWYCMNADYHMLVGGPHLLDGNKFIFASNGKMLTGWQQAGGKWYYLNPSDGKAKKGWYYDNSYAAWYYFEPSGTNMCQMLANTSRNIGGVVYRFDGSGKCLNPNG